MKSNCCEKNYFACYLDENNILPIKLKKDCFLLSYPEPKNELPEKIIELSPRFHNLYSQAYCVELKGHFELAGCGYRNALEILIKDFAVKELKISEEEVQKQSLCTSIKKYLTKNLLNNAAEVVRILGNSYTHYKNEYPNIDFYVLKDYLSIIINDIDRVVKLKHPPVRGVNTV
jgi:hypothetical protein